MKDDMIIAENQLKGRKNTFEAMVKDLRKELDEFKKTLREERNYLEDKELKKKNFDLTVED